MAQFHNSLTVRMPVTRQVNFSTSEGWRESHSCRVIAPDVEFMTPEYAAYLQSEHWKRLRRERLELSGYKCDKCGSAFTLQVHHLRYRKLYDVTVQDLVTVCNYCHEKEHGIKSSRRPIKPDTRTLLAGVFHIPSFEQSKKFGGRKLYFEQNIASIKRKLEKTISPKKINDLKRRAERLSIGLKRLRSEWEKENNPT